MINHVLEEECYDTKRLIEYGQKIQWLKRKKDKTTKPQTMIYKTLLRKLKIERNEPH